MTPTPPRPLSELPSGSLICADANVDIRPLTHIHLHAAKRFRRDHGMMANDSLLSGFMIAERIQHLASNDRDFRRVPDFALWVP